MNSNMFRRSLPTMSRVTQARKMSSIPEALYGNVWKKSNIFYITYVLIGCVVVEGLYGNFTNYVWDSVNYGKLYHQIDWSKFKSEDEEDE